MLLASAGLLAAAPALALTANELFEDGNRLYRSDLFWAALLRYRQAGEQGMASPVLDYNMGVAHYRAATRSVGESSARNRYSRARTCCSAR